MRVPLVRRDRVDFALVGSVEVVRSSLGFVNSSDDSYQNSTSFGWGLGVGYWCSPHWQLSLTAMNPLVEYDVAGGGGLSRDTNVYVGAVFQPVVTAMLLYL